MVRGPCVMCHVTERLETPLPLASSQKCTDRRVSSGRDSLSHSGGNTSTRSYRLARGSRVGRGLRESCVGLVERPCTTCIAEVLFEPREERESPTKLRESNSNPLSQSIHKSTRGVNYHSKLSSRPRVTANPVLEKRIKKITKTASNCR